MDPLTSPLLTNLYQLNMIQAYLDHGDTQTAVFEFFVRKLPARLPDSRRPRTGDRFP
jgi:nicotinate phosphoribosyltransferase